MNEEIKQNRFLKDCIVTTNNVLIKNEYNELESLFDLYLAPRNWKNRNEMINLAIELMKIRSNIDRVLIKDDYKIEEIE